MEKDHSNTEIITEEMQFRLIDGIGNIEAKLLTVAIIAANPDIGYTRSILNHELTDRQGSDIDWRPSDRLGAHYCQDSIEPIGAAVKGSAKGQKGPIDTFKATEFGIKYALPFSGAVLDWSLKYPDISIQKLFGVTATTGDQRSPSTRYLIYQAILTDGSKGSSYQDLVTSLEGYGVGPRVIESQLRALDHLGIVSVNSKDNNYNPIIRIVSPDYSHVAIDFDSLKTETQLFYKTTKQLFDSGKYEIDLQGFLSACRAIEPEADLPKLRQLFLMGIQDSNSPSIVLLDRGPLGLERTYVTFGEDYQQPIEELCNALEAIKTGENLESYSERARQIVDSPADFSRLMTKSKRFSSAVRGKNPEDGKRIQERLIDVLANGGGISAKQAAERLSENGDVYAIKTVKVALNGLVKAQHAAVSRAIKDPSKKSVVEVFSLVK